MIAVADFYAFPPGRPPLRVVKGGVYAADEWVVVTSPECFVDEPQPEKPKAVKS